MLEFFFVHSLGIEFTVLARKYGSLVLSPVLDMIMTSRDDDNELKKNSRNVTRLMSHSRKELSYVTKIAIDTELDITLEKY